MAAEPRGGIDPGSDAVIAFRTEISRVMGKVARLGPSVEQILKSHAYPEPISHALGEALVLAAMLGASLRDGGKLILQTKTNGRLPFLVVHYDAPGRLRGYANFDKADQALAAERGPGDQATLLGTGHLMMTLDQGDEKTRYQGIVELENQKLVDAAHTYFRRSEQLPTFIRLAVARAFIGGAWTWRAGGLMIQHLLAERGQVLKPGESGDEMLDPTLSPERLLIRLFHEEGVRAGTAAHIEARCRCSKEYIATFLKNFGPVELADMRESDGAISVTCEFCATKYRFTDGDLV
jgi:molecular chaperone Hsp33